LADQAFVRCPHGGFQAIEINEQFCRSNSKYGQGSGVWDVHGYKIGNPNREQEWDFLLLLGTMQKEVFGHTPWIGNWHISIPMIDRFL
jgi:hypothetical protein